MDYNDLVISQSCPLYQLLIYSCRKLEQQTILSICSCCETILVCLAQCHPLEGMRMAKFTYVSRSRKTELFQKFVKNLQMHYPWPYSHIHKNISWKWFKNHSGHTHFWPFLTPDNETKNFRIQKMVDIKVLDMKYWNTKCVIKKLW